MTTRFVTVHAGACSRICPRGHSTHHSPKLSSTRYNQSEWVNDAQLESGHHLIARNADRMKINNKNIICRLHVDNLGWADTLLICRHYFNLRVHLTVIPAAFVNKKVKEQADLVLGCLHLLDAKEGNQTEARVKRPEVVGAS